MHIDTRNNMLKDIYGQACSQRWVRGACTIRKYEKMDKNIWFFSKFFVNYSVFRLFPWSTSKTLPYPEQTLEKSENQWCLSPSKMFSGSGTAYMCTLFQILRQYFNPTEITYSSFFIITSWKCVQKFYMRVETCRLFYTHD